MKQAIAAKPQVAVGGCSRKPAASVMDKFLADRIPPDRRDSLAAWSALYFQIHVLGSSPRTMEAKRRDLRRFLGFFSGAAGSDHIQAWTPAVSKAFQHHLEREPSPHTGRPYSPATVNRVLATVRHFGRWLNGQCPLLAGDPLAGVRDLAADNPDWRGLSDRRIMRLKSACEQRVHACRRQDQNPLLEAAVFYCLLYTGLREFELCSLDLGQYARRGFHDVRRKGRRVQKRIPLPKEARRWLDRYLDEKRGREPGPLFITRYGGRLRPLEVQRICARLARQASAHLPEDQRFHFTPHMLRHTFLKRVADKHGVHVAQEMSGNISSKVIFRYTKPSAREMANLAETVFE